MAIALVGSVKASAFSTTVTVSRVTTAGNLLVAFVQHQSRTSGFTITDNTGGTWTLAATTITPGSTSERLMSVYYRLNSVAISSVTVTYSAGNTGLGLIVDEYSGVNAFRAANATSTGTDPKRSLVSATANDMVISAIAYSGSAAAATAETGYSAVNSTNISTTWLGATRNLAVGSTASQGPTWTGTGTSGIVTLAFSPYVPSVPPTANAGPDQTNVEPYSTVTLSASASTPGSSAISSYSWVRDGGPTGPVITGANTVSPTVYHPGTVAGATYTYTVTVSDGTLTSTDQVAVTVLPVTETMWDAAGVEIPTQWVVL